MTTRYDHPNVIVRREFSGRTAASANGTNLPMLHYQKLKMKAVHARVVTAGTNVGNNIFTIRRNTTNIGTIAIGTATAGSIISASLSDAEVGSLETVNALKGADATGVVDLTYEYEVLPEALQSA